MSKSPLQEPPIVRNTGTARQSEPAQPALPTPESARPNSAQPTVPQPNSQTKDSVLPPGEPLPKATPQPTTPTHRTVPPVVRTASFPESKPVAEPIETRQLPEQVQVELPPSYPNVQSPDSPPLAVTPTKPSRLKGVLRFPFLCLGRCWDFASLVALLAVVAAIPVVQLASLGYLLHAAANLAARKPWSSALPGLRKAGKLGTFLLLATLLWLPVWLLTDLAYSAQLLEPNSSTAVTLRRVAFLVSIAWVTHVGWSAIRGGRWWHMLWPAPVRFVKSAWRWNTWKVASDRLYDWVAELHFPQLWWLGARGAIAVILWTAIPVSLMIIGQRAQELPVAPVLGLAGALGMIVIMFYLPFLQIHMALENRFIECWNVSAVRRRFQFAPWALALSLLLLCLLSLPLYLLRIEATPAELLWAPSLIFVLFMLPAKILMGAAMGWSSGRMQDDASKKRHWTMRWSARPIVAFSVLTYVGALYFAQLIAGQGALVMYFQHALLVPAPLISS